jgi:hypothetical protein
MRETEEGKGAIDMDKATSNKIESSKQAAIQERRRYQRFPFTATVEAVEIKSQARIEGRTSDVSLGGCYVDTTSSFSEGSIVKIRLTMGARSFEAEAKVVYSLVNMGMGLKFTNADLEHLCLLDKWVADLSREPLPNKSYSVYSNGVGPKEVRETQNLELCTAL